MAHINIPKNKTKKSAGKKYAFNEPVITDDRNWRTERREQWKKESLASQQAIMSKYGVKTFTKPPVER